MRWGCAAIALTAGIASAQTARDGAPREIALTNGGFESALAAGGQPPGWSAIGHASVDSYTYTVVDDVRHSGAKSLRIANVGAEPFGTIVQKVSDPALRGRTVRFSAWLRTSGVTGNGMGGGAALLLQALRGGTPIVHDHMRGAEIKGTTDWQRRSIMLAVPDRAEEIEVGAMLFGPGTLWLDDATLEVVAR